MDALAGISTRATPQAEQADERQVPNAAGGYVFPVTPEVRLRRFLTLGTEGGTYYVGTRELTRENAAVVMDFARNRTADLVREVVEISTSGRAPRQNPCLFALAAAAGLGDVDGRRLALAALPQVARTGTHLFLFVGYAEQFRGWGRSLRRAVAAWYTDRRVEDAAYQMVKYRSRS
jgi:60 kDa SS-A/Ro ribonucleoprotein